MSIGEPAARASRTWRVMVAFIRATTGSTVEGDPIPVVYLAGADGKVEVITDSRQDNFGEKIRTRMTCAEPIRTPRGSIISFAQCSQPTPIAD